MRGLLPALVMILVACAQPAGTTDVSESHADSTTIPESPLTDSVDPLVSDSIESSASVDRVPATPVLDPISGYGDFSHLTYSEVDWILVTELQVQCANDQGIPVRVMPPGDGMSFDLVAVGQHLIAGAVLDACLAGMNLPPYEPSTEQQILEYYHNLLELASCLEGEGFTIEDAPSAESFVDTYVSGEVSHPYDSVPVMSVEDWNSLNQVCPQP